MEYREFELGVQLRVSVDESGRARFEKKTEDGWVPINDKQQRFYEEYCLANGLLRVAGLALVD